MKKKFMVLATAIIVTFSLVGCSSPKAAETSNSDATFCNSDIYEFVDPDTGVHYWIYSHAELYKGMGGMTPRLNSDGSVMCDK